MDAATNLNQELDALEHRRELLQKLVRTAASLENLRLALEATGKNAQSDQEMPASFSKMFKDLGNNTRNMSDADILMRLKSLDQKVVRGLKPMLAIIEDESALDARLLDDAQAINLYEGIDKFRRVAQTALGLRIMMEKRGVKVPGFRIPVAPAVLQERLSSVQQRENDCRDTVVSELNEMKQELEVLLQSPGCSGAMQEYLQQALDALLQNFQHMAAGLSIKDLPVALDFISLRSEGVAEMPLVSVKVEPEPAVKSESMRDVAPADNVEQEIKPIIQPPLGLWGKFKIWLNSPWKKGWKDIDKDR